MNRQISAVMLDVSGIQNYIFSTNMLKQNLGASYIVEKVMSEEYLGKAISEGDTSYLKKWKENPDLLQLNQDASIEIAYTGGGNAVLLFKDKDESERFAKRWTKNVISEFPGLQPVAGKITEELDIENPESFKQFFKKLREKLNESKALEQILVDIPRYGFTANCIYTGDSAQYNNAVDKGEDKKYHSFSAREKIRHEEPGYEKMTNLFKKELGTEWRFPRDFNEIAGPKGRQSRIAIIHIDGNNMGKQFSTVNSLQEYREKSIKVNEIIVDAVAKMIQSLTEIQDKFYDKLPAKNKMVLFRPVILGGDDITYVIHGDLGIWSAVKILNEIKNSSYNQSLHADEKEKLVSAAAGIVITKPSFPFSQSYELAEELMSTAKKRFRGDEFSFSLNFFQQIGGALAINPTSDSFYNRPFNILNDKKTTGFDLLFDDLKIFRQYPSNKQKELREVVYQGEAALDQFKNHLGKKYQELKSSIQETEKENSTIMDVIEFAEISPYWLDEYLRVERK